MSVMQVQVSFLVSDHHFHLHNRHPGWILGVCYAGESDVFFENRTFACERGTWHSSYVGKIHIFLIIAILPRKTSTDNEHRVPELQVAKIELREVSRA